MLFISMSIILLEKLTVAELMKTSAVYGNDNSLPYSPEHTARYYPLTNESIPCHHTHFFNIYFHMSILPASGPPNCSQNGMYWSQHVHLHCVKYTVFTPLGNKCPRPQSHPHKCMIRVHSNNRELGASEFVPFVSESIVLISVTHTH
jgi:hypothetical protein